MENNLAYSMGKTFGYINKIMENIENIENISSNEKSELFIHFSNLLCDLKKSKLKISIKKIEQKITKLSETEDIEESKELANEIYLSINDIMKKIYFDLKYNV